jgi:glucosamine--fructose-6-phosphate aminotransferase (isomerizing)
MCGIFGYLGPVHGGTSEVVQALLTGLRRLEYRGYDSAGIAFDANDIVVIKGMVVVVLLVGQRRKVEDLHHQIPLTHPLCL